jgi:hypothetical protein
MTPKTNYQGKVLALEPIELDDLQSIEQLVKNQTINNCWYNTFTDCRSVYDDAYSTQLEQAFDIVDICTNPINKKYPELYESLYDLIDLELSEFEYDLTDEYWISINLVPNNVTSGTHGTLAQLDPFATNITITDSTLFNQWLLEFIEYIKTNPSYRHW